jgi:hypothetical protein
VAVVQRLNKSGQAENVVANAALDAGGLVSNRLTVQHSQTDRDITETKSDVAMILVSAPFVYLSCLQTCPPHNHGNYRSSRVAGTLVL